MTKNNIVFMISAFFLLSACAPKSDLIVAKEVPTKQYEQLECTQLAIELEKTEFQLQEASMKQDSRASTDTMLALVGIAFYPLWFGLLLEDQPFQVAELKGQKNALDNSVLAKNC